MPGYTNQAVLTYYFARTAAAAGRGGVIAPERPTTVGSGTFVGVPLWHPERVDVAPPTTTRLGDLGLTDRERDVAELAVSGYSYAQIARDLFVAHSTVGYHLSNIYAKCGVSSRHELTALVRGAEVAGGRR